MTTTKDINAEDVEAVIQPLKARKPYTFNNPFNGANFIVSEYERDQIIAIARAYLELSKENAQLHEERKRLKSFALKLKQQIAAYTWGCDHDTEIINSVLAEI